VIEKSKANFSKGNFIMKLFEEFKLFEDMWDDSTPVLESYVVYSAYLGGWKSVAFTTDITEARRAYTKAAKDKYTKINVLVKFNNLTADQAKKVKISSMGIYALDEFLASCGVDFEILEDTSAAHVSTTTKKAHKTTAGYKYYYVVCIREEAFGSPEVLAAGTTKVDLSTLVGSETPAERAMTDYFDSTEIAYSDDWDDDMWDSLTRYVYEIDATTYKTETGLPKTDSEIIRYVEESLADYEE
jgi:hypothetical protein